MLHGKELSENTHSLSNGNRINLLSTSKNNEVFNHLDEGTFTCNRGRQGEFRDVKSIIADFRQQNPEVSPRVGKRVKQIESNSHYHNFCIPIHVCYFCNHIQSLHHYNHCTIHSNILGKKCPFISIYIHSGSYRRLSSAKFCEGSVYFSNSRY